MRPILHPIAGRSAPEELRPGNVGQIGAGLAGGVQGGEFRTLLQLIEQAQFLEGNRVLPFFRGQETFAAMRAAIDTACHEVLVESYIFKDDATGRSLSDTLARAAERGVEVRVLADAFGSIATRRGFWNEMRSRGIEVRLFHPLFPHVLLQPFRDHRKILVVDRKTAFTGGMNIGDEYGSKPLRSQGPWRDSHVQIDGPAAWEMATVFTEAWAVSGGGEVTLRPIEPGSAGTSVLVLSSRPGRGHSETASVLAAIVGATRRRLWITNAYFAPSRRTVDALGKAAQNGVDVRLLLPGRTDVPLVRHAGHGHYATLLERGVRIFEYQGAVLHAKTLVADDFVSLVGSTNLDFRSFHFNSECNVVILDSHIGQAFAAAFEDDLPRSDEVTASRWGQRSLLHSIGDAIACSLGRWL